MLLLCSCRAVYVLFVSFVSSSDIYNSFNRCLALEAPNKVFPYSPPKKGLFIFYKNSNMFSILEIWCKNAINMYVWFANMWITCSILGQPKDPGHLWMNRQYARITIFFHHHHTVIIPSLKFDRLCSNLVKYSTTHQKLQDNDSR